MATPTNGDTHSFFIPVMGTGFTVDTPLRVAKYGISSVISLVDDVLVEQMRKFHSEREGEPYEPIVAQDEDPRARRITAYLDLIDRLVQRQVKALQASPFEPGSDIARYYDLLPDSPLKRSYNDMLAADDAETKAELQAELRRKATPGGIDVNIMTKVDRQAARNGSAPTPEAGDAHSALRGFGNSVVRSAVVLSAGLNARLYAYLGEFDDFFPTEQGAPKKTVVLKVSDYRSAEIQGKYLAKRGIWVSEYRIESGLNCGGHAFATTGLLMGPILEEFKQKREALIENIHKLYIKTLDRKKRFVPRSPLKTRMTVQGGITEVDEDEFLYQNFDVDATGWCTPFLLVPEVVNLDDDHLKKLAESTRGDVELSQGSPFGIPFWSLRNSASEETRRRRIEAGKPGSPCGKGYLMLHNTDYTETPICTASRTYLKYRCEDLANEDLSDDQRSAVEQSVLAKACICHDLAGGATLKHGIDPDATPAICCGPNIVNFTKIATLEEMVGHIYGKLSLLANTQRPHMFVRELQLYVDYLRQEIDKFSLKLSPRKPEYFTEFKNNLLSGIEYYRNLAERVVKEKQQNFIEDLQVLREAIELLPSPETS